MSVHLRGFLNGTSDLTPALLAPLLFEGDGSGGGGSGSGDGSGDGNDGAGGGGGGDKRPDGVPDKFWNDKTGVDVTGLGKAYSELQTAHTAKRETMFGEFEAERLSKRPETIDGYKFQLPKDMEIPAGYDVKLDDKHPMLGFWRQVAHDNGMDQKAFEKGVGMYFQAMIDELPTMEAMTEALGERGADRVDRAHSWLKALMGDEGFAGLGNMAMTPAGIEAVEKMMEKAGAPPLGEHGAGSGEEGDNLKDEAAYDAKTRQLQEQMLDEPDPKKKEALRAQYQERLKKRYPGQTGPEINAPGAR